MATVSVALISGANRGIGRETARQLAVKGLHVIVGSRDEKAGAAYAEELRSQGLRADAVQLDVSDGESINRAAAWLRQHFTALDILINNAGIYADGEHDILTVPEDVVQQTLNTNLWGPFRLARAVAPLLKNSTEARIINVSSGLGALSDDQGTTAPSYSISKTALNALTKQLSAALASSSVAVNSVCPGWVRTDMGGSNAHRSVEKGTETIVWLASEAPHSLTGKFLRDKEIIPW